MIMIKNGFHLELSNDQPNGGDVALYNIFNKKGILVDKITYSYDELCSIAQVNRPKNLNGTGLTSDDIEDGIKLLLKNGTGNEETIDDILIGLMPS